VRIPIAETLAVDPSGYTLASGTSFSSPIVSGAAAWVWTVRPTLDSTQLFEIMRRSARDIGAAGFDDSSGYGLLDIPNSLAFAAPSRDPQEPNETAAEIEPGRLFAQGTAALTNRLRTSASLRARVDKNEDPVDLYRVWAPAKRTLTASTMAGVSLRIMERTRARLGRVVAVARSGKATYRARTGGFVYVEVRPLVGRTVDYTLRLTAARR
jgi:hypothetical protein